MTCGGINSFESKGCDIADAVSMLQAAPAQPASGEDEDAYRKITDDLQLAEKNSLCGRYYFRVHVKDREGVLATVSDIMAKEHISFATVNQKDLADGTANLMVTTHETQESAVIAAKKALAEEDAVIGGAVSFRIFESDAG